MGTWIDSLFQRETVPLLESSLGFAHHKHLAIMNNIANVENPYYKRQDVPETEFMRVLGQAIEERSRNHINEFRIRDSFQIRFRDGNYPVPVRKPGREWGPERHDRNSVVIEKEMADLAKNTLKIQTLHSLLRKKFDMMKSSLRDRIV